MVNFDTWTAQPEPEVVEYLQTIGGSVLDVGCGDGRYAYLFEDYTGFDPAKGAIARARKKYPDKDFIVSSLADFETDWVYDYVLCSVALGQIDEIPPKIKTWGKKIILIESPEDKHDYDKIFNIKEKKHLNCRVNLMICEGEV